MLQFNSLQKWNKII